MDMVERGIISININIKLIKNPIKMGIKMGTKTAIKMEIGMGNNNDKNPVGTTCIVVMILQVMPVVFSSGLATRYLR